MYGIRIFKDSGKLSELAHRVLLRQITHPALLKLEARVDNVKYDWFISVASSSINWAMQMMLEIFESDVDTAGLVSPSLAYLGWIP
jgi:hypothetical protein